MVLVTLQAQPITTVADSPLQSTLLLKVSHVLDIPGDCSSTTLGKIASLPAAIEIQPSPSMSLHISADHEGSRVGTEDLERSALFKHVYAFIRRNMNSFGLTSVVRELTADGLKIIISAIRPTKDTPDMQDKPVLKGWVLHYSLKGNRELTNEDDGHPPLHPFTRFLSLPYQTMIHTSCVLLIRSNFIRYHIRPIIFFNSLHRSRRYPRIFSEFHTSSAAACTHERFIGDSIQRIVTRSLNGRFRARSIAKAEKVSRSILLQERRLKQLLHDFLDRDHIPRDDVAQTLRQVKLVDSHSKLSIEVILPQALAEFHRLRFKCQIQKSQLNTEVESERHDFAYVEHEEKKDDERNEDLDYQMLCLDRMDGVCSSYLHEPERTLTPPNSERGSSLNQLNDEDLEEEWRVEDDSGAIVFETAIPSLRSSHYEDYMFIDTDSGDNDDFLLDNLDEGNGDEKGRTYG